MPTHGAAAPCSPASRRATERTCTRKAPLSPSELAASHFHAPATSFRYRVPVTNRGRAVSVAGDSTQPSVSGSTALTPATRALTPISRSETTETFRTHSTPSRPPTAIEFPLGRRVDNDAVPDAATAFLEAAEQAATLRHPNVVRVLDHGTLDGRPYITTELVEGLALTDLITYLEREQTAIPRVPLILLATELASALEHAHRHTAAHGLLRTDSVLLTETGACKVTGFGVRAALRGTAPAFGPAAASRDLADLAKVLITLALAPSDNTAGSPHPAGLSGARPDLPAAFLTTLETLLRRDSTITAEEALVAFESLLGCDQGQAEAELGVLVRRALTPAATTLPPQEHLAPASRYPSSAPGTETMLHRHEGFVRSALRRLFPNLSPTHPSRDDLLQAGRMSIVQSWRRFREMNNSTKGFQTFAWKRLEGEIIDEMATSSGQGSRRTRDALKRRAAAHRADFAPGAEGVTANLQLQTATAAAEAMLGAHFATIPDRMDRNALRATLDLVPFPQHREFLRRHLDEQSYSEIGAALGVSKSQVMKLSRSSFATFHSVHESRARLERLDQYLPSLKEPSHRKLLALLYQRRFAPDATRRSLKLTSYAQVLRLHREALDALRKLPPLD